MQSIVIRTRPTRADLLALLRNEILSIRIPAFLSECEVGSVLDAIDHVGIEFYVGDTKAGTAERKGKIGPNLFRFKDDIGAYYCRLTHYESDARPILFSKVDVPQRFKTLLQSAVGVTVARAQAGLGPLADCTVRSLPGAPLHTDWIVRELPTFEAFDGLLDQFAWNVYLKVGESGGQTLIYDTTNPATAALMDAATAEIIPQVGELILFRSRNVHAVNATLGDRLTISGFWGPCVTGDIRYWV